MEKAWRGAATCELLPVGDVDGAVGGELAPTTPV